jgi:peroxiredoxin
MAQPIKVGDKAPDFELPNQEQKKVKLSDFAGKKNVVLAFYPFDWSPVCQKENVCFTQDFGNFSSANAEVLGISIDSPWSHKAWAEKMGYKHNLLADVKKEVIAKYGLLREDIGCAERATVVVDKSGKVAYVKVQEILTARDNKEILGILKNLN